MKTTVAEKFKEAGVSKPGLYIYCVPGNDDYDSLWTSDDGDLESDDAETWIFNTEEGGGANKWQRLAAVDVALHQFYHLRHTPTVSISNLPAEDVKEFLPYLLTRKQ